MNKEENFGKKLFLNIAYERIAKRNFLKEMTESELSELFIWVEEKFPDVDTDEDENVQFGRNTINEVHYFKNYIIGELKQRGNIEAQIAIEKIKLKLPNLDWLNYVLYEAKIIARQKKWSPLQPNELLKLLANKNLRFIGNENDLLMIVLESLDKLQIEMQGTPPSVKFIWNSNPVTPKLEADLSDFIKLHLQRDLSKTVVNREVEIRPPLGERKGENIDLLVQTFSSKSDDLISLIIEVKGSWNQRLKKDMEEQLKKRYLMANLCKYGIYLVGWFLCDPWDKSDYRYDDNPKMNFAEVESFFIEQTKSLSGNGYYLNSYILDCRI